MLLLPRRAAQKGLNVSFMKRRRLIQSNSPHEVARRLTEQIFTRALLLEGRVAAAELLREHALAFGVPYEAMSADEALDAIYRRLRLLYPSEFVLKNELLNRVFLARHDPQSSTVLTEMRVGRNRVDLVVVNGTTTAYEVKSRFDSLMRLRDQVVSYQKVFDRVYVVCNDAKVQAVLDIVDQHVGVMTTNAGGGFRTVRRATSSESLTHAAILSCMRKPEMLSVVKRRFRQIPDVPNMLERATYLKLLQELPVRTLHLEFARVLRARGSHPGDAAMLERLPYCLRLRYYELAKPERARVTAW